MAARYPENLTPPLRDISETLINQNDTQKKDGDVYNNTLYFIKENIGIASQDVIADACIDRFSEVQIETAKITLIEKYKDVLDELDPEKTAEIIKPRRKSSGRAKA